MIFLGTFVGKRTQTILKKRWFDITTGNYQILMRKKYWTWLGITTYPRGRNIGPGWELPDNQEEEILDLAGNHQIPKRKKYWTWVGITQDKEILHMAVNYQIPKRKKYWTWLGITRYPRGRNAGPGLELPDTGTQEEQILLLAGNSPIGRNPGPGWE